MNDKDRGSPIPDRSTAGIAESDSMQLITRSQLRNSAALLLACQLMNPSFALGQSRAPGPAYPGESEITFQWDYSSPKGTGSFSCPDGGASHVTNLTIYLGTIPVGSLRHTPAMLYNFSTRELPSGNGFVVSTGLSTLSCQVNGMTLDYSGPPRSGSQNPAKSDAVPDR